MLPGRRAACGRCAEGKMLDNRFPVLRAPTSKANRGKRRANGCREGRYGPELSSRVKVRRDNIAGYRDLPRRLILMIRIKESISDAELMFMYCVFWILPRNVPSSWGRAKTYAARPETSPGNARGPLDGSDPVLLRELFLRIESGTYTTNYGNTGKFEKGKHVSTSKSTEIDVVAEGRKKLCLGKDRQATWQEGPWRRPDHLLTAAWGS